MATITLQTVKTAAAALHKAEGAIDASNAGRTLATKTLLRAFAGFAAANKATLDLDALMPIIYGDKWADFAATVKKSRKTNWKTVAELAEKPGRVEACITAAEKTEKDFRATFFKAATMAKNDNNATVETMAAALTAKKAATVKTAGDRFEAIIAELAAMLETDKAAFALVKPHAVAIHNVFLTERGKNKLRFARELAKKDDKAKVIDFAAA